MTAVFVTCPGCERLMIGDKKGGTVTAQPHDCKLRPKCPECRNGAHRNCCGWAIDEATDEVVDCGCVLHAVPDEEDE